MVWARMADSRPRPPRCAAAPTSCTWRSACRTSRSDRKLGKRPRLGAGHHRPWRRTSAADAGATVSVGFEDASRADPVFLVQAAAARRSATAPCACAMPTRWACSTLHHLRAHRGAAREIDIGIEIHAHNDLGLATANTLAAMLAGATHASTTVNGLGERAGNAALEEVVMAARHLHGVECGIDTPCAAGDLALVAQASGRPVAAGKSIVGEAVFTHESGIHVDGLLKDRQQLRSLPPRGARPQPPPGARQAFGLGRPARCLRAAGPAARRPAGAGPAGAPADFVSATKRRAQRRRADALLPRILAAAERRSTRLNPHPGDPMDSLIERLKALSSAEDFLPSSACRSTSRWCR
jgi:hypothetical protein